MFGVTPFNRNVVSRKGKDPFSEMIDDFFGDDFFPIRNLRYDTFKVDIREEDQAYMIEADMPGVKKEDIHLDYHDGLLDISIEHEESKEEEKKNYIHKERRQCSMHRTLNLGDLDADKIEASLKDGILSIKAPKAEVIEHKKRIQIK
jgi:HSP20 family protein